MSAITDPARELGEIAKRLTKGSKSVGSVFLAEQFGVSPWSTPFYRILACILERADLVASIIRRSPLDDDHKEDAIAQLAGFKSAFAGTALVNQWNTDGQGLTLMQRHGQPVQFLSSAVRPVVAYPRLSEEETNELLALIERYREELKASDEAPAFVRQAILDGLASFQFQLEYMGWMGAGYTLAAFRQLMLVYESVNRNDTPDAFNAAEVLGGLGGILKTFKEGIDRAQSWADTGGTVMKAWQLTSSVATPLLIGHSLIGN